MRKRAFYYGEKVKEDENHTQLCQFEECRKNGLYKAPKKDFSSHQKLPDSWHWFCLDHVREYNASWNYFGSMSEEEILKEWHRDITWQRPTWPLGSWYKTKSMNFDPAFTSRKSNNRPFEDPFGLFEEWVSASKPREEISYLSPFDTEAINLFELSIPFDSHQLQTAYRRLVKKFHPDVNQGCLKSEEKLKTINQAYTLLKKMLSF